MISKDFPSLILKAKKLRYLRKLWFQANRADFGWLQDIQTKALFWVLHNYIYTMPCPGLFTSAFRFQTNLYSSWIPVSGSIQKEADVCLIRHNPYTLLTGSDLKFTTLTSLGLGKISAFFGNLKCGTLQQDEWHSKEHLWVSHMWECWFPFTDKEKMGSRWLAQMESYYVLFS